MRGFELQKKLSDEFGKAGTAGELMQAFDPESGRWYWLTSVQTTKFHDSDGDSTVTTIILERAR